MADITFDSRRGHIAIVNGQQHAELVESGDTLSLWTSTTVDLDPEAAIALANTLRAWVKRRAQIRRNLGAA